ncbi:MULTISPECIES: glycosyltransferase [Rodentibacter]|uniref:glycosyltransferase n=1 Tax=Rodentibacter TaxID=1960084 RepID=UPI001CFEB5D9|nr:glycosyltransferase [Rodentibacter sp. JRC1]GJI55363.1 glycosyl transferase [Rodentibacter sp. JRC1]
MLSVLMSIYHKEKSEYFNQAMESIWTNQTLKPDEIVLVQDGPLTTELEFAISEWKSTLKDKLKTIPLEKNVGLGNALSVGLKECSGDFIARMDTDDIAMPERFEKQIAFLKNNPSIDVVGCFIEEINEKNEIIKDVVSYPLSHKELYNFFSKRDPIAHPTCMFRRSFFEKGVKYLSDLTMAEDTLLWYQGFLNNCKFANINYVGLKFRRSSDFYKRRANWKKNIGLLKFRLFHINRDLNYGIKADFYAIAYFMMSISPSFVKRLLYKLFR